ncbi:GNAT family N-acetyltransferase [Cellulomonas hominis]|uniref:GNAT family N-acetyltransferase n=1 Tax=Cellulomonas hominis TaxID=156981 RepID=A0A7Z8K3I0_9CELL|nr:GNAT family N-acetyltransferase [Cellulomonas hominis]TKR27203.1 GNAT family N-acetyltransferase [Cellulomonas hominis]
MRTRLLALADVTDAEGETWHRLADHAAEPNVYLDPRFLIPARDRGRAADGLRLLVVEDGPEWLAALAVTTKPFAPRLPLRAATTGGPFMTWHADRHHPLLRAGREVEAIGALLRGARSAGLPGLLQLQHVPLDGPVERALAAVTSADGMAVLERRREVAAFAPRVAVAVPEVPEGPGPVVDPPLAWDHMATDERRNMRRGVRGLAREAGGPLELHDVTDRPGADDDFIALQAAGWKGDAGRGGAALALDPVAERWFRAVVGGFRRDKDLRVVRLAAGGATLWTGYALRSGTAWFGFLDAYAEAHRRYSPGSVGRVASMTYLLATTDAPFFDPAFDSRYATGARIFPSTRTHVDLLVATGGPVAAAVLRAVPSARRLGLVPD